MSDDITVNIYRIPLTFGNYSNITESSSLRFVLTFPVTVFCIFIWILNFQFREKGSSTATLGFRIEAIRVSKTNHVKNVSIT